MTPPKRYFVIHPTTGERSEAATKEELDGRCGDWAEENGGWIRIYRVEPDDYIVSSEDAKERLIRAGRAGIIKDE